MVTNLFHIFNLHPKKHTINISYFFLDFGWDGLYVEFYQDATYPYNEFVATQFITTEARLD